MFTTQNVPRIQGDNLIRVYIWLSLYIVFARFTDAKSILGSQQLLMNLIANGELNMKELNSLSLQRLKSVMVSAGFEAGDINK